MRSRKQQAKPHTTKRPREAFEVGTIVSYTKTESMPPTPKEDSKYFIIVRLDSRGRAVIHELRLPDEEANKRRSATTTLVTSQRSSSSSTRMDRWTRELDKAPARLLVPLSSLQTPVALDNPTYVALKALHEDGHLNECSVCNQGGKGLLMCDGCAEVYHAACLPPGFSDWPCPQCQGRPSPLAAAEGLHNAITRALDHISKLQCSSDFHVPVLSQFALTTYAERIEQPMDLKTMRMKHAACCYSSLDDVVTDVETIVSNCLKFNDLDDPESVALRERAIQFRKSAYEILQGELDKLMRWYYGGVGNRKGGDVQAGPRAMKVAAQLPSAVYCDRNRYPDGTYVHSFVLDANWVPAPCIPKQLPLTAERFAIPIRQCVYVPSGWRVHAALVPFAELTLGANVATIQKQLLLERYELSSGARDLVPGVVIARDSYLMLQCEPQSPDEDATTDEGPIIELPFFFESSDGPSSNCDVVSPRQKETPARTSSAVGHEPFGRPSECHVGSTKQLLPSAGHLWAAFLTRLRACNDLISPETLEVYEHVAKRFSDVTTPSSSCVTPADDLVFQDFALFLAMNPHLIVRDIR